MVAMINEFYFKLRIDDTRNSADEGATDGGATEGAIGGLAGFRGTS